MDPDEETYEIADAYETDAEAWEEVSKDSSLTSVGETYCDNGLLGVSAGTICCSLGCGECGGDDCDDRGDGLTADGKKPWSTFGPSESLFP